MSRYIYIFLDRAHFDFFVSFENTASCKCSTICWLSLTLSACLRCRALTGTYYTCFAVFRAWLIALYCVTVVDAGRQHSSSILLRAGRVFLWFEQKKQVKKKNRKWIRTAVELKTRKKRNKINEKEAKTSHLVEVVVVDLSLIHIWRCRRRG